MSQIKWQSADIRVDFKTKTIQGVTQVSFVEDENHPAEEPFVQRLCFRHGTVSSIKLINPSKNVKWIRYSFLQQGKHDQAWKQIIRDQMSLYGFEQASAESEKIENSGLLVIHGLKTPSKAPSSISPPSTNSQMEIEDLNWTVEISFSVHRPSSGLVFHQDNYLICDQRPASGMSWMPCGSPSNTSSNLFKEFSVTLVNQPAFTVISSFPCINQLIIEGNSKKFRFLVNKVINVTALGFVAGPFVALLKAPNLFWKANSSEKVESRYNFIIQTASELVGEFLDPLELKKMLADLKIALIPNIAWINPSSLSETLSAVDVFLGVPGLAVVDESLATCEGDDDSVFMHESALLKQILMSLLGERLASTRMEPDDMWIRVGLVGYISDMWSTWRRRVDGAWILHQKFRRFYKLVENGMELSPLSPVNYPIQEFACYDPCFLVKSELVFHLLNSHLELHLLELIKQILSASPSPENQGSPSEGASHDFGELMSTQKLYRHIKFAFGIKNLRFFFRHFINRTGVSRFSIQYEHQTRENKLDLLIKQNPLQANHFKRLAAARSKFYSNESSQEILTTKPREVNGGDPLVPVLQRITNKLLPTVTAPLGMTPSALLASLNPSSSSVLLINPGLCSSRFFRGFLAISVVESTELELRPSFYRIKVEEQQETKKSINLLQKIKRKFARRGNHANSAIGGGSTVPPDDDDDNLFGGSERGGMGGNPNPSATGSAGKNKNLWLQIDPYNAIFKVFDTGYKEEIYHLILNKELKAVGAKQDVGMIFEVLDKLQDFITEGTNAILFRCLDDISISPSISVHLARTLKKIGTRPGITRNLSPLLFDLLLRFRFRNRDKRMLMPPPYSGPLLPFLKFSMANLPKPLLELDQLEPMDGRTINDRGFIGSIGDNKSMMSIERSIDQSLDNPLESAAIFGTNSVNYLCPRTNIGGPNGGWAISNPAIARKLLEVGHLLLKMVRERENDSREEASVAAALKGVMMIGEEEIMRDVADEIEGLLRMSIGGILKGLDVQRVIVGQIEKWIGLLEGKEKVAEDTKRKIEKIKMLTQRLWDQLLLKPFFYSMNLRKKLEAQKQKDSLLHAYSALGKAFVEALQKESYVASKAVLLSSNRFLLENAPSLPFLIGANKEKDLVTNFLPFLLESHRFRDIAFGFYSMIKAAPFLVPNQPLVPFDKAWFSSVSTSKPLKSQKKLIQLSYLTFPKKRRAQDVIRLNPEKKTQFCARDHLINACNLPLSHSGGLDWRLLARGILQVLLGDPITRDLESRLNAAGRVEGTGGGRLGVRLEIEGETLRSILEKLGKNVHVSTKYIDFEELYGDVKKVLENYKKYNQSNVEMMAEMENVVDALFHEANLLRNGAYQPSDKR